MTGIFMNSAVIKFAALLAALECDYEVVGTNRDCTSFCSLFEPVPQGVTWARAIDEGLVELLRSNPVSVVFCNKIDNKFSEQINQTLIQVDDPRMRFMRVVKRIFHKKEPIQAGIHPSAIISPDVELDKNVSIGAFAQVGKSVLGNNVVIKSHAIIHDGVKLGNNVLISEFCNIGGEGFGHIKNENNQLENQLHIGVVDIEDFVEIFPFSNVDRATLGSTRIGAGTKIDHYCHIGHNSKIGNNNTITPNVTILGGVVMGNDCMIGCGTQIRETLVIGNQVTVGMSSTVTKNIPDGATWVGSPAEEISAYLARRKGMHM